MNVAIVGCGLIGKKRARAIMEMPEHLLGVAVDVDISRAREVRALGAEGQVSIYTDWKELVEDEDVHAVVVATTHDLLAPISLAMVKAGKHVLVEKPGAIDPKDLEVVFAAAKERGVHVHVGYSLRYHPALMKAWEICDLGDLGKLTHLRAVYGHGGRLGYEREWRADPKLSGGGELVDQGSHLINLAQWFLGLLTVEHATRWNAHWKMPVEDNAIVILRNGAGAVAHLHASWTEWRNQFRLEVFGERGELRVDGLGGSYGTERLTHYAMAPDMRPPSVRSWEWLCPDRSFVDETCTWMQAAGGGMGTIVRHTAPVRTLEIVGDVYRISRGIPGVA